MKIFLGGLYHESNTFNPFVTSKESFVIAEGEKMLDRIASTEIFKREGAVLIPSIYATALSSGIVTEEAYRYFADKMLNVLINHKDIDGIWLHLHGSMTVQNVGSGELQLVKEIREIVGHDIPISITLDIHANNANELVRFANIIRSYRTVPHIDQSETEKITAELLIESIQNKQTVKPTLIKLPMIISGEKALGNQEPLNSIFKKLELVEQTIGISTASFFIGFAWADTKISSASVLVVPQSNKYSILAEEKAKELADYVYSKRKYFKFEALALDPNEAIDKAINSHLKPIFISDSGDNTTGGGIGINTGLVKLTLSKKNLKGKKILFSSIFDKATYDECQKYNIGDNISINIGVNYDENSKAIPIRGILKSKGDLMGYLGSTSEKVGEVCTINIGNIDIAIANKGDSFITLGHFSSAGLNIKEYDIIVVKQGYLFDELSAISKLDILALTPGATYQILNKLKFENILRPMFPLDK